MTTLLSITASEFDLARLQELRITSVYDDREDLLPILLGMPPVDDDVSVQQRRLWPR